ncbi:MAG: UbiH/UbiF/VisC/COQ6 family ubiquinone biosynthesis hydroxylase [Arenicellales bacterium]
MSGSGYDILVVGAGMVGASFAAALADSPFSVALLDAGAPPEPPPAEHYDLRVSAVSPGSRDILKAIGAWDRLDASRIGPYRSMCVWDACSEGSIEFDASELGESWLGFIIENANIQYALRETTGSAANIECRFGAEPERLVVDDEHCRLTLSGGEMLTGKLVVGADGAHSWVRQELGVALDMRLYGQKAFVCEVRTALPHRMTAWQRFLPSGPVAFLPLANGHCSVVWTCDAELAEELTGLDEPSFGRRLEAAFDRRLGEVEVVSAVRSFDLSRRSAAQYVVERGALIGDAAHVVHPLAGQGVNLGFGDACSLARVLLEGARKGRDIGRRHVLRRFERWRRSENFSTMRMLDALHGLFSTESTVVHRLRGLGLDVVDHQDWLKHFLTRQALGTSRPRF